VSAEDLVRQIEALGEEFARCIAGLNDEQEIRAAQAQYLGKKGKVSELMRGMGKLPGKDKKPVGEVFNRVKQSIAGAVEEKLGALLLAVREADLARSVDVSLPGRKVLAGRRHLISQIWDESVAIFAELGFGVADGPQVETDFNCFEALAIPKDHPARDEQDTFYVSDEVVLRTHTSPVQIRTMMAGPPPIRVVIPGIVYRRDDDATHSPMFTQMEGLCVDKGVRFSDLKGVLLHWIGRYFGKSLNLRFRPSYFPFVEPGAEVDMQCVFCETGVSGCRVCKGTGWVEIGGAGMVDPEVFGHVNYDAEEWTGFAFGFGLERMAMLRHGVNDIKYYYSGDIRFLEQF